MEPFLIIGVPGVIGGVVLAFLFVKLRERRNGSGGDAAFRNEPLSTDVINMSRIRVAGIGGLGLVAMAVTVALNVPRIGQTLSAGLVFGALLAAILILRRRREGPMPSSGRRAGANTTLSIDAAARADDRIEAPSKTQLQSVVTSSAAS